MTKNSAVYRFALRPKWIAFHLLVIAITILFALLGLWQLSRLDQRKATNELVRTRADAPTLSLADALARGEGDDLRFLRVEVEGKFLDQTIFIDNRSFEGAPGSWLATPFQADDLSILVVRGFVGRAATLDTVAGSFGLSADTTTVEGLLQPSATGGGFAIGREGLPAVSRPNTNLISTELGIELTSPYLQLEVPIEETTAPIARPNLDNGPHLGYALQWFVFASLAPIGYALILRRFSTPARRDDHRPRKSVSI